MFSAENMLFDKHGNEHVNTNHDCVLIFNVVS